ncbi:hypothetical protein STAQ_30780 [Allostella sp. ATCC 35155]|nr:hypothetical protein STAQ_30780 [Stella sp. ATCC 35155]
MQNPPACPDDPRARPQHWRGRLPGLLLLAALGAGGLVIFLLSDLLLPDPLGGPIIGDPRFDKGAYGQTIGQVLTSFVDTHVNICLALFVVVGFALNADREGRRCPAATKAVPGAVFLVASVLSVFFGGKAKLALLAQLQFDRVSIERIEPALNWQSATLLVAVVAAFALVYLVLRSEEGEA